MENNISNFGKKLSKKHWMPRLYKYSFGKDYEGRGWCVLFWSSWLAIGLLPFTLLGKGLGFLGGLFLDFIPEKEEKKSKFYPQDHVLVSLYEKNWSFKNDNLYEIPGIFGYYERIKQWLSENPNWRDLYPAAKARQAEYQRLYKIQQEREEALEAKREARRQKLKVKKDILIKFGSYLVKPLLFVSAGIAVWFVYLTVGWLFSQITLAGVIETAKALGAILTIIVAGYGVLWMGRKVFNFTSRVKKILPVEEEKESLISRVIDAIIEGISFLSDTVKLLYTKNCPIIEWADETKPIEKLKKD